MSLGFLGGQSGHEFNDEVTVIVLQHAHITHGNRGYITANNLQTDNALINFRQHFSCH